MQLGDYLHHKVKILSSITRQVWKSNTEEGKWCLSVSSVVDRKRTQIKTLLRLLRRGGGSDWRSRLGKLVRKRGFSDGRLWKKQQCSYGFAALRTGRRFETTLDGLKVHEDPCRSAVFSLNLLVFSRRVLVALRFSLLFLWWTHKRVTKSGLSSESWSTV